MDIDKTCAEWAEYFSRLVPVLEPQIKIGNFRVISDGAGGICAQWTNTNIFPAEKSHVEYVGGMMFKDGYVLKSTLIGIEMTAKK